VSGDRSRGHTAPDGRSIAWPSAELSLARRHIALGRRHVESHGLIRVNEKESTPEPEDEDVSVSRDARPKAAVGPRLRVAEVLAFVAVVAAFVGALGPAERVSTTYSWPPPTMSEAPPSRLWYTPLLLARRLPESMDARLPCSVQRSLPGAKSPVTVLATARSPERARGLAVRNEDGRLTVAIGWVVLARVPLFSARAVESDCAYQLSIADDRWSIAGGPDQIELDGELVRMPVVNGLFSALHLRAGQPPSVEVTTQVHSSHTITRQTVLWIVATLCLVVALLLVGVQRRPRWPVTPFTRIVEHAHPADAVIAFVLVGWWVVAPVFWDDGWTLARQGAFSTTGGFSNYYDSFGAALPLGYWLEWAQHWLTQNTTSMLALRVPALLCLASTWLLCRWILSRLLGSGSVRTSVPLWALAASFAVSAMAWGMTLRPEPVVALLVIAVVACVVRFTESKTSAPLVVMAVLVPLAITAHPAGIVSVAPVIVFAPSVIRWVRTQPAAAATILMSTIALLLVLGFVGSDIRQRSTDAQIVQASSTTVVSWRDEITRYDVLSGARSSNFDGYGTPLRRASVALIVLAIVAFAVRRRRNGSTPLDLPSSTLAVALVLLIATPSKWPWHFGALIGLAALAVAAETARLEGERERLSGWQPRQAIWIGAVGLAIAWSWAPQRSWNALDLMTFEWTRPFEVVPVVVLVVLPLLVLAGVLGLQARRTGGSSGGYWPRFASWTFPVLVVPMILFTATVLVADTAATNSWTFTRQNLESLRGGAGCGLADDLRVPSIASVQSVPMLASSGPRSIPAWVPPTPVAGLPRFALVSMSEGSASSPWFELPRERGIGVFVAGTPGPFDRLRLEWGQRRNGRIESLGTDPLNVVVRAQEDSILLWRFMSAGDLPLPNRGAEIVRVLLRADAAPGTPIAVTAPVVYTHERLTRRIAGVDSASLVLPNLRMYTPCVRLPRLAGGTAEVPSTIVTTIDGASPIRFPASSPFAGLLDVYRLERVPLADRGNPRVVVAVFEIDRRVPGAKVAPATQATSSS
jgi:hypothetical protein